MELYLRGSTISEKRPIVKTRKKKLLPRTMREIQTQPTVIPHPQPRKKAKNRRCIRNVLCSVALVVALYYAFWLFAKIPPKRRGGGYRRGDGGMLRDIVGCEALKKKAEGLITLLKRPNLARHLGLRGIPGAVFFGPDGTGKRSLAQAIANEVYGRYVEVDMEQLTIAEFPDGHQMLQSLFNDSASSSVPSIIFVKRADLSLAPSLKSSGESFSISSSRHTTTLNVHGDPLTSANSGSRKGEFASIQKNELLLHTLTREHERAFERNSNARLLLILSARQRLNRPYASWDRFEQFHFTNPSTDTRALLFSRKLLPMNSFQSQRKDDLVQRLAKMTHGLNGRDISRICQKAALKSLAKDLVEVNEADVEEATEEVVQERGVLQEWERKTVAYHEAGHAVVSWRMENADQMLAVSIVPDNEGALGYTQYDTKGSVLHTNEQVFSKMVVALSGRYAEQSFMERLTTGARDDLQKVTALAYYSVATYGFDESNMSFEDLAAFRRIYGENIAARIDADARELIDKAARVAKNMVETFRDQIDKVATTLLDRDTLEHSDMVGLLGSSTFLSKNRQQASP